MRRLLRKKSAGNSRKSKLKISGLFYNNKFVMIFSVVAALVLWFIMSMTNTTERPWEVNDVPIDVVLSSSAQEQNLKVFDQSANTATVSVSGNSVIVSRLQPTDLKAEARLDTAKLSSTGLTEYTLSLTPAKVSNELSDYTLVSVNPREVTVWVDAYQETSYPIEDGISYGHDDKYFYNTPTLSAESVTISGPKSSVSKIERVVAEYSTEDVLTSTQMFSCPLVAYDKNGEKVDDKYLEFSTKQVDATVVVSPRSEVKLIPSGINMPASFSNTRFSVDPETIMIAAPEDALKNLEGITLDPVDFSEVNLSNTKFSVKVSLPQGFKNISNTFLADVDIDLTDYEQKSLEIPAGNITVKNAASTQSVKVTSDQLQVLAVGPETQISKLASSDVYATLDMSGQEKASGTVELPVTITFKNASGCWAYGKYTVNATVTKN